MSKQRLSASVDADLIEAAEKAVARGHTESVSAWVNEALRLRLSQERRLDALEAFMAAYEREQGEITSEEMQMAARRARQRAVVIRGGPSVTRSSARSRVRAK
jgi:Arc/MetJ-type ribon-helix-helix transcriptional regulator